ncbi:MAG: leucyl aminopeptidase [Myxococcales bacterium]|nr:leucyl aminopeptidase [Myxococcales bacterium]
MLVRFATPALASLDELDAEVLAAGVYEDVRPARGVAGLCDWRLGGRISRLMSTGFISGKLGEVVMIPGKPLLTLDKVLLVGLGRRSEMGKERLAAFLELLVDRLSKLRARAAVVELAGRPEELVEPLAAIAAVLDATAASPEVDSFTLVEKLDARAAMEGYLAEQRRRVRRAL